VYFIDKLTRRVVKYNKNATILVVGDYVGCGKSYLSMKLAEEFHIANNLPPFIIDNIGFFPEEFLSFVRNAKKYSAFIFDDAGLSVSSRQWYSEINQILTNVVESYRFLNLVCFITVPIRSLVDKNIRELSNFLLTVSNPGEAKCYQLRHAHFAKGGIGATYQYHMVNFSDVSLPSLDLCEAYEDKKAEIMLDNYEDQQNRLDAKRERDKRFLLRSRTDESIIDDIKKDIGKYRVDDKIDIDLIQHFCQTGYRRSLHLKNLLSKMHGIK